MPPRRKASPLAARTPGCSAASAARSARHATTRCASWAACSSRCTGAASFRDDLLAERAAAIVGIDARLAEIDELLHARGRAPRCECGAPILRGSRFCPNCGRSLDPEAGEASSASEETVIEPAPEA